MPLLEIVRGERSGAAAVEAGLAFAHAIDKLPLPVKSAPGFLVNRALIPYLMAAAQLLDEGHSAAAIDEAAEAYGMPMGPLTLADSVGLDVCLHVGEILGGAMAPAGSAWQAPRGLARLVEQGHLGRKTGQGFYRYDKKGKPVKAKREGSAPDTATLQDRLLLPLLNTCVACWREALVDGEDLVDAGMIFGTGFAPFRGGPMHYIRNGDAKAMQAKLKTLAERHGWLYEPDSGWDAL
jgi:3-hydroxyacyl-CoA dehydrogenase/enoyl-CoA hydratase/3-hydroxybutyryl-CoA epimerase